MSIETKIVKPTEVNITRASQLLANGELISFPTETVYGLGANALDAKAIAKIFQAKRRPLNDPLIVHTHDVQTIFRITQIPKDSHLESMLQLLADTFWPGPLSIVLPKRSCIPGIVTSEKETVAVRIPNHPVALKLLQACDFPIAAPSANTFSYVSPTCAEHVMDGLGDSLSLILDGGDCSIGIESTVISLTGDLPVVLRPGGITIEQIEALIGPVKRHKVVDGLAVNKSSPAPSSPGLFDKHYSPKTPVVLKGQIETERYPNNVGLIRFNCESSDAFNYKSIATLSENGNLDSVANQLFATLRAFDKLPLDLIVVDSCEEKGLGTAIMDRLKRATQR